MTTCLLHAFEKIIEVDNLAAMIPVDPFEPLPNGSLRGYTPGDFVPVLWNLGYTCTMITANSFVVERGVSMLVGHEDLEQYSEPPYVAVYLTSSGVYHAEANITPLPETTEYLFLVRERIHGLATGKDPQ